MSMNRCVLLMDFGYWVPSLVYKLYGIRSVNRLEYLPGLIQNFRVA